ncbi:S-adenosyl-L-methionine-dependent methyltransferase [Cladochytrium replicatum]|nr:S-adenosyl-L-methionine-dependent methyltransferase [Cladochytrium replicatum]
MAHLLLTKYPEKCSFSETTFMWRSMDNQAISTEPQKMNALRTGNVMDNKEFWRAKYEKEAKKNWDMFFKDRHWTDREFPELRPSSTNGTPRVRCGVGNFVFPLLEVNKDLFIYACDFSPRAVEMVKKNEAYDESRCTAFVCDLTVDDLRLNVPADSLDLMSSIFVMSAIPPPKLDLAIANIHAVLKRGTGTLLFRDYARDDAAQHRFKSSNQLGDNYFARQDMTLTYFFTVEELTELFTKPQQDGTPMFEVIEVGYVEKEVENRKLEVSMKRVFIQAKFRKR